MLSSTSQLYSNSPIPPMSPPFPPHTSKQVWHTILYPYNFCFVPRHQSRLMPFSTMVFAFSVSTWFKLLEVMESVLSSTLIPDSHFCLHVLWTTGWQGKYAWSERHVKLQKHPKITVLCPTQSVTPQEDLRSFHSHENMELKSAIDSKNGRPRGATAS